MDKKGIELSVNFLVVIIISIVVFGFGVTFVYRILNNAGELSTLSQEDIDRRIIDLRCGYNQKVCLEQDRIVLESGKNKVLTMQVTNIDNIPYTYQIEVIKGIFVDKNSVKYLDGDPLNKNTAITVLPRVRQESIEANSAKSLGIGFAVPRQGISKGTYVFDIVVKRLEGALYQPYDEVKKIYLVAG